MSNSITRIETPEMGVLSRAAKTVPRTVLKPWAVTCEVANTAHEVASKRTRIFTIPYVMPRTHVCTVRSP